MNPRSTTPSESEFIRTNVPLFIQRYALSYHREDFCIEYFINSLNSNEIISNSLIFAYSPIAKDLHVSRFHPELYLQANSKYLSAACIYLIIHHFAAAFSLDNTCLISLETVPMIYQSFYRRLKDFDFHIAKYGLYHVVELISGITRLSVDTNMIKARILGENETPFLA